MEYDCEMFDDAEAALDALLAKAQWESLDAQAGERLREFLVSRPRVVREIEPEPAVAPQSPTIETPLPPLAGVSASNAFEPSPGTPGEGRVRVQHDHVESVPETALGERSRQPFHLAISANEGVPGEGGIRLRVRSWLQPIAIAASVLLLIGAIVVAIHVLPLPSTIHNQRFAGPIPGRAPTPLELWQISPAGQRYLAKVSHDAPVAPDPRAVRIAQLCRFADSQTLASAALHESSPDNQARLLTAMLSRRDGADRFLDLVLNRSTRDRALGMLTNLPNPPTDLLLAQLNSPSVAHRFAAAKALGTLCHGGTLPELARMIETGDHSREALAVLSQCNDPGAIQYMRKLQSQPSFAAQLMTVRNEMKQLF